MELIWNEIAFPRLIAGAVEQTELTGALPPPDGKLVAELIDYGAEVFVDGCRTDSGKLTVRGRIAAKLVAAGEDGEVFAFTSESAFEHIAENDAIEAGMIAEAAPSIADLSVRLAPDGSVMLNAAVDIDYSVLSSSPLRVLSGVSGVGDMELKSREAAFSRRVELGRSVARLSDELSSDGAEDVVSHSARVSVRETAIENGGVTVSGVLNVSLLIRGEDGELTQISRALPFRENVETSGAADEVYAHAEVVSSSARALGTEFSLIALDADVALTVYSVKSSAANLPLDAFSPTINFDCVRQKTVFRSALGGANVASSLRETASLPEGLSDIYSTVGASVRPVVTEARVSGGVTELSGVLSTRVVYRASGGRLNTFTEDVPFSITASAPAGADSVKASVTASASITGGSGRSAQIAYNIDAFMEFFAEAETDIVAGLAENTSAAADAERPTGLIIHTACAGDTFFDVARRFRIPSRTVREMNEGCSEPLNDGDKLVLIV